MCDKILNQETNMERNGVTTIFSLHQSYDGKIQFSRVGKCKPAWKTDFLNLIN